MKPCCALAVVLALTSNLAALDSATAVRLNAAATLVRDARASLPPAVFEAARCIAAIPSVNRAAFVSGTDLARGVFSCRAADGWSAPVFVALERGAWKWPDGVNELDLLLLVMNENGVQRLMKDGVRLGADVSVAAGPPATEPNQPAAGARATSASDVFAYSRAGAAISGIDPTGALFRSDAAANREAYGPGGTPSSILASRSISAPTEATPFLQALGSVAAGAVPTRPVAGAAASANAPPLTDADFRSQLIAMRQAIDQMLAGQGRSPVSRDGGVDDASMASVPREALERLRTQIEALIAELNGR